MVTQGELPFQIRDLLLGGRELLVAVLQLTPKALIFDGESVGRGAQRLSLSHGLDSPGSLRLLSGTLAPYGTPILSVCTG